jgi:AcrR family transcriptional regulator
MLRPMALPLPIAAAPTESHVARRWEIWHAAAPLFERHGYRGVTVEQLAYASAMSPAGLYHYFPNKAAIALFPLAHGNGLCVVWDAIVTRLPDDPIVRLEALIEVAADHAGPWRIALALSRQMTQTPAVTRYASRLIAEARRDFATIARSVDPEITDRRAADLYEAFTAIVVAEIPGFDSSVESLRRRLTDAVRGWLAAPAGRSARVSLVGAG